MKQLAVNVGLTLCSAAIQLGSGVLALVYGFGLSIRDWRWVCAGFAGVVFGKAALIAVVDEVPRA